MHLIKSSNPIQNIPYYVFDTTKLVAGDIMLSTVPTSALSWAIRKITKSGFSHAAICTEHGGLFIEAVGLGVARFSIARIAMRDLANVRLLRLCKDKFPDVEERRLKAAQVAESYLLNGYFLKGALLAPFRKMSVEDRSQVFCSHLVSQAYREAGVELLPGIEPTKTTPGTIAESKLLRDITDEVTLLEHQNWYLQRDFVEEGDTETWHHREVKTTNRVTRRIGNAFEQIGVTTPKTFNEALLILVKLPVDKRNFIDDAFLTILSEEGYLDLIDDFLGHYESSFYVDELVKAQLQLGQLSENDIKALSQFYAERALSLKNDVEQTQEQAETFNKILQKTGLRTVGALLSIYRERYMLAKKMAAAVDKAAKLLQTHNP